MNALGREARSEARVYFTGGVTAVLNGWRESTVDIDIRISPELTELFQALPQLKERLRVNIELASPPDFIPPLPGWEDRSIHITRVGKVDFYHFDLYSQALSKIERNHSQDKTDVEAMFRDKLIDPEKLFALYDSIAAEVFRYPALDAVTLAAKVRRVVEAARGQLT